MSLSSFICLETIIETTKNLKKILTCLFIIAVIQGMLM